MELWGGVECTVNRVGDHYVEQIDRQGHSSRISDLDQFAELGISSLRQPVLWERVAPRDLESANWSWSDAWLARLRELRIRPILGLLHHGSGPAYTNLLDQEFPEKFASYARAVAERYPWADAYTPINEPLTTARFSGLYGHWYPHRRDDHSFVAALLNQCRATVLAMREIRAVNPAAQLVQTDDLCRIFSTAHLRYQAEFENERRWLGHDLLCGRVDALHPLFDFLVRSGAAIETLDELRTYPCPPDIIGVNRYLTSDRFLDERLARYPSHLHGGNCFEPYADVVAARVCSDAPADHASLLRELWERYRIPVALTEVHNGCTREEQLRWLLELWRAAEDARAGGVNVIALTLWSLLGAFDWHSLVTNSTGNYESGVFEIRAARPRPTAVAHLAISLAAGQTPVHPLLEVPGWWRRAQRFEYGLSISDGGPSRREHPQSFASPLNVRPLLITGARGTLGNAIANACAERGIAHRLLLRSEMDIADQSSVLRVVTELRPWAVINAAGYVRVDEAESDWKRCYRENVLGPATLAAQCRASGIRLVSFSSDLVFDGDKHLPYVESDGARPLNWYGMSKMVAEREVLELLPTALVIRSSAFFGPWDEYNFLTISLRRMARDLPVLASAHAVSPTYVPDLANKTLDLLIDGEYGIWHLSNRGEVSWAAFAMMAADQAGLRRTLVQPASAREMQFVADRPYYSVLGSEKAQLMPPLEDALARYMRECVVQWRENIQPAA